MRHIIGDQRRHVGLRRGLPPCRHGPAHQHAGTIADPGPSLGGGKKLRRRQDPVQAGQQVWQGIHERAIEV